jgi:hypothetical protein
MTAARPAVMRWTLEVRFGMAAASGVPDRFE